MFKVRATYALLLAALLFAGSPAEAHNGTGLGFNGNDRLEAEDYNTPDSSCDPDYDAEHTSTGADNSASGGKQVFLPHSGCGLNYGSIYFDSYTQFTSARIIVGGTSSTMTFRIDVHVDGSRAATGTVTAQASNGWVNVVLAPDRTIPTGNHEVRVSYAVTSGPSYANLFLDYVDTDQRPPGNCHLLFSPSLCYTVGEACRARLADSTCAIID